jgi:hypothetical protein
MGVAALRHTVAELGTVREAIPFDDYDLAEMPR